MLSVVANCNVSAPFFPACIQSHSCSPACTRIEFARMSLVGTDWRQEKNQIAVIIDKVYYSILTTKSDVISIPTRHDRARLET